MSAHFASVSEPADVRPGTKLGRFEILVGIAQGGMARVWAARQQGHRGFTKIVAIKTILPTLTSDPSFEAMFLDEARVAASVHHPNVCQIFDLGEESGVLYLAMEWVNGESLARILKPPTKAAGGEKPQPQRLNARIAARIIADAAAGLHAAHELCDENGERLDVVHRDVSPQNILVSLTGNVKVTDFGVAKALGSSHEATAAGQIKGKAAYMSPEQASAGRVDRRSDIFALGIVLYEITTGRRPFHGENQIATLKLLLDGRFDPPSAIVPGYPRELESIVLRALALDPAQRFPTADRLRISLEEWLARSGPVVTETQVGTLVRERVGGVIEERQTKIRERSKAPAVDPRASQASFAPPSETSDSKISEPSAVSHVAPTAGNTPSGGPRGTAPAETPAPSAPMHAAPARSLPTHSAPSHPQPHSTPSHPQPAPPSVASGPASAVVPPTPAASGPSPTVLAAVLGALALVLAGLIAIGVWVLSRSPEATTENASATPGAPPAPTAEVRAAPPTKSAAKLDLIKIVPVEPKDGVSFELDGKPLSSAELATERPAPGKVKLLTANAEGYEREVFRIDDATPDVLEVLLAKKTAGTTGGAPAPREPSTSSQQKPADKKKPMKPDIPDNPF